MTIISRNVNELSDSWDKRQTSNNAKMLALNEFIIDKLLKVLKQLDDSLDLNKATGKTLDYYGEDVGQKRGNLSDDKFRLLIMTRIAVNVSGCDFPSSDLSLRPSLLRLFLSFCRRTVRLKVSLS